MLALSLATALAAAPVASFAAQPGNWFISGQVGQSRLQGMTASKDTATGSVITAGYRWDLSPTFQFGAEAGYANIGKFSDTTFPTTVNGKLDGYLAGVTGKLNFTRNWYMSFEGGYFDARQRVNGSTFLIDTTHYFRGTHTKGSFYSGIGFGYDFGNNVGLGVNYNYFSDKDHQFDLSSNLVSVSMEVRF